MYITIYWLSWPGCVLCTIECGKSGGAWSGKALWPCRSLEEHYAWGWKKLARPHISQIVVARPRRGLFWIADCGSRNADCGSRNREPARRVGVRRTIADCGFQVAQDRIIQSRRSKLKLHSCFTQYPVCNQKVFNLKSKIYNLRSWIGRSHAGAWWNIQVRSIASGRPQEAAKSALYATSMIIVPC